MVINGQTYDLDQLRQKMPRYNVHPVQVEDLSVPTQYTVIEPIEADSHEEEMDKDPVATTNPNLHLRFDESQRAGRGEHDTADPDYMFLGLIGTKIYSSKTRYNHDEDDTEISETP